MLRPSLCDHVLAHFCLSLLMSCTLSLTAPQFHVVQVSGYKVCPNAQKDATLVCGRMALQHEGVEVMMKCHIYFAGGSAHMQCTVVYADVL